MSDNQPTLNELLHTLGVVEGTTKQEPSYVREVYNVVASDEFSSVIVLSRDLNENTLELLLSAASDETHIVAVDDPAKEIRRRISYRRGNQNNPPKVSYGDVIVTPLTTTDGVIGVKVRAA